MTCLFFTESPKHALSSSTNSSPSVSSSSSPSHQVGDVLGSISLSDANPLNCGKIIIRCFNTIKFYLRFCIYRSYILQYINEKIEAISLRENLFYSCYLEKFYFMLFFQEGYIF